MDENHTKFLLISLFLFVLSILLAQNGLAYTLESVQIEESVNDDLSVFGSMIVYITNNTDESLLFSLPSNTFDLYLNDEYVNLSENTLTLPLNCETCTLQISYVLYDSIKDFSTDSLVFYKILDFPQTPESLTYVVNLSTKYVITKTVDTEGLSVVPLPTGIQTYDSGTLVSWIETKPELPKVYQITFKDHEQVENSSQEFISEFSERGVWFIVIIAIIFGVIVGFGISQIFYRNRKNRVSVPSSLLSPDEKTALKLLQKSKKILNQKEVGLQLNWSKSKVSAIMSNLQYKKIITKEKIGRNYTITVIKEIEES